MATKPTVTVNYKADGYIGLLSASNVQRVDWNVGRSNITDPYSSGTCSVYGRGNILSSGFPPAIGKDIRVKVKDGATEANFYGVISDVRQIYGIRTTMDTYEIHIDGSYAQLARNVSSITTTAGASTSSLATSIIATLPTSVGVNNGGWGSTTSAQTYTGQNSDPLDVLMATEQGVVVEYGEDQNWLTPVSFITILNLYGRNATALYSVGSNTLTDDKTTYPSEYQYSEIEFLSAAQNYGTKVIVNANGLASQSSGTGNYVQSVETINSTTSEAANLAGYIKTQLDLSQTVPVRVSFSGASNTSSTIFLANTNQIKQACTIRFRGQTYTAIIEGLSFSADASNWECNWILSSSLANAFLKLDNTSLGIIGTNKLGF